MQIIITEELGAILKNLRKENGVNSKDISLHLNKSPTYFSKLESGNIKKMELRDMMEIFRFIFKGKGDFKAKFEEFIGKCTLNITPEDKKRRVWLMNFDTIMSQLPIPPELLDYCKNQMDEIGKTIPEIVERINLNEDISDKEIDFSKYEPNFWHDTGDDYFIIMNVSVEEYEKIFNGTVTESNYTTMYAFLYTIFKFTAPSIEQAEKNTKQAFKNFKFFSVAERNNALRETHTVEEREEILTQFDKINLKTVNGINRHFKMMSDFNIAYANTKLNALLDNFREEKSLTMAFIGIDLRGLKNLSIPEKKEFIEDIKNIVNKYAEKAPEEEINLL